MSEGGTPPEVLAEIAALLFAVDPQGLGGIALRARPGSARDAWMKALLAALPESAPVRRVPLQVSESRLIGGLDLAATLHAGRPVAERGLLAEADGGLLILSMAERLPLSTAALVAAALDNGEIHIERDGLGLRLPARFGIVALDEGIDDERPPAALLDRFAFHLDVEHFASSDFGATRADVAAARALLPSIDVDDSVIEALCTAAASLGIDSVRAPLLALKAACAAAALDGRRLLNEDDLALAARLVLAPRATMLPAPAPEEQPQEPPAESDREENAGEADSQMSSDAPLEDMVLAAAEAAIPPGLLAELRLGAGVKGRKRPSGRAGAIQKSSMRGRPTGVRRGDPRGGARLNLIATLVAAAPWQILRRREMPGVKARILVRREDFRLTRFKQRTATTTIFVVDASGSAALHRLAEAKGAVELLLAECYVRRDQVALLAFRGAGAELLLPPTRSLARAKRSLAGLPGGGGTPLATAIDAASALADAVRRKGQTPLVIFLTDGQANVGRDGKPGRPQAAQDTVASAKTMRAASFDTIVVDTSPQPRPEAQTLAAELGARYLALPYADAQALSQGVIAATRAVA